MTTSNAFAAKNTKTEIEVMHFKQPYAVEHPIWVCEVGRLQGLVLGLAFPT